MPDTNEPTRDWVQALDLNRSTVTKSFVDRLEECMRAQQTASDDLKEVIAQAKEAEFTARDIEAMKKIAKLRLKDQRSVATDQLEALSRISKAVDFDLFTWAEE